MDSLKIIQWVGTSLKDLRTFPKQVREEMGYALYVAQRGGKHSSAKPMKGFSGASVLELIEDYDGDTYRAIYTVKFAKVIYVLHAFQKKSKQGIATPRQELELLKKRLKQAEEHYSKHFDD